MDANSAVAPRNNLRSTLLPKQTSDHVGNTLGSMIFKILTLVLAVSLLSLIYYQALSTKYALFLTLAFALVLVFFNYISGSDPFNPMVFPLMIILYFLLFPIFYMLQFQRIESINLSLYELNPQVVPLTLYSILGYIIGATMFNIKVRPEKAKLTLHQEQPETVAKAPLYYSRGLVLFAIAVIITIIQYGLYGDLSYGVQQTEYSLNIILDSVSNTLLVSALFLVLHARAVAKLPLFNLPLVALLIILVGFNTVALGSRADLIPVLLLVLMVQSRADYLNGKPQKIFRFVIIAIVVVNFFNYIGDTRSVSKIETQNYVDRSLADTSSSLSILNQLSLLVPETFPYEYGQTYLRTIPNLIPGARRIQVIEGKTAALQYRDIIDLDNPDYGVGFAYVAEAYLNFGPFGILFIPMLGGAIMSFFYRFWMQDRLTKINLRIATYPVLVAILPFSIRSDSLYLGKTYLFAILAIIVVYRLSISKLSQDQTWKAAIE